MLLNRKLESMENFTESERLAAIPTILGGFVRLNATNSIRDMAAVYEARQMDMHAKIIFHAVATDVTVESISDTLMEAGAKLGITSGSLGRMIYPSPFKKPSLISSRIRVLTYSSVRCGRSPFEIKLVSRNALGIDAGKRFGDQDAERPEGWINAGFAALEIYHNFLKLLSGHGGISGGAWAFAHYFNKESTTTTKTDHATSIQAGELNIDAEEWHLIGTQIEALRGYFKTKYLGTKAAEFSSTTTNEFQEFDVEIPLSGGAPAGFSGAFGKDKADAKLMMNAVIHIHEDLRLEVSGHADMRGIKLSAKSLEAFFNSLLLESMQDLAKNDQWSASFGLSSTDISGIGGQISKGERHAVRELSSIIGTEKANIVVANALRLNGGMIAAAHRAEDGSYSEHGRLTLRVGELFVQHIYDYDDGYTLGAAISTDAFAPTIGGHSGSGTTFATIGKGDISCTGETCQLGDANRDVTKPQTFEQDYDVQPITAYFPLGLPDLPKTPDGKIDWDKAEANVKDQFISVLKPFKHLFTSVLPPDERPTEQSPPPG